MTLLLEFKVFTLVLPVNKGSLIYTEERPSTFLTVIPAHLPPRLVATPVAFSSAAIVR